MRTGLKRISRVAAGLITETCGRSRTREDPEVPFAPETLVAPAPRSTPRLGRIVHRTPLWEGYFHLHELRSEDGRRIGLDWRKGPLEDAAPSALDARTSIVAAITSVDGGLCSIFGESSPRICNLLRGRPYVQYSPPGGRIDKRLADEHGRPLGDLESGVRTGLNEVREETGGQIVEGLHRPLSEGWTPTCAALTSEADRPVGAFVILPSHAVSTGDGGKMEITHVQPTALELATTALALSRTGRLNEASRWEPYVRDFLEGMGYSVEVGDFVKRDPVIERAMATVDRAFSAGKAEGSVRRPTAAVVERVVEARRIDDRHTIFHLIVDHAYAREDGSIEKMNQPHPNIFLHAKFDLAKVVEFYVDDVGGPMVRLRDVERPVLADPEDPSSRARVLRDVLELQIDLPFQGETVEQLLEEASKMNFSAIARAQVEAAVGGRVVQLGAPDVASAGQCDAQFHFFAVEVDRPGRGDGFIPLSSALAECRESEAATKAILWRLADHLRWFVRENMSVATYAKKMKLDERRLPKLI